MGEARRRGRPNSGHDAVRDDLVDAARRLFLQKDFHKVSVREIAREAGANSAMIRYYFGSKQGLYEAMLQEVLAPLQQQLDHELQTDDPDLLQALLTHAEICQAHPELVVLLMKTLTMGQGPSQRFLLDRFARANMERLGRAIDRLIQGHGTRSDIDPVLLRVAVVSLAVGPQVLRPVLEQVLERDIDEDFYRQLAEQNVAMLLRGAGIESSEAGGVR